MPRLTVSYPTQGYADMFRLIEAKGVCPKALSGVPTSKVAGETTIRACFGLNKLAQAGYLIFCPWDFHIVIDHENGHKVEVESDYNPPIFPSVAVHTSQSVSPFIKQACVIKIALPLSGKDNSGTFYMIHGADTHNKKINSEFSVSSGITDFKHSDSMNVFCVIKGDNGDRIDFMAGDALAQLIPITADPVVIEEVIGDRSFYERVNFFGSKVRNRYYNIKQHFARMAK